MKDYSLVLAADLPHRESLLHSVREAGAILDGIKLGAATLIREGSSIIERVLDITGPKILLVDMKVADIGFRSSDGWDGSNWKIIKALENTGATHITVHGFPGPASIAESIAAANDSGLEALLLPLMSHRTGGLFFGAKVQSDDLISELRGIDMDIYEADNAQTDVTGALIRLGDRLGVHGFIGPATRPDDLKRYRALSPLPVWCPGFGRQDRLGRTMEDQFRQWAEILGPRSAAIVGSSIIKSADQAAAAKEVVEIRDRTAMERTGSY
jgi:orotidine-5'-phosphate decarboxylase